jgi:rod shape determining protein RodA
MAGSRGISFKSGPQIDTALLIAMMAVVTIGLVNLYSATSVYLTSNSKASLADNYVSQVYWIVVGSLMAILVAAIDYRHYERLGYLLYFGGLGGLGLVFVLGTDIRGSSRWIFGVQPSEFMKPLLVIAVAKFLHNDPKTEPRTLVDLAPLMALIVIPVGLVMAQPDLGTAIIYLLTCGSMVAMTRIRGRSVLAGLIASGIALPVAWNYLMHGYQKARITSFLDPEADKTGTGWHALQSRTAIGNGGLWGEGYMQGTQNQFGFLPDQYSDFPFAVFAEDWGFVGCLVLLAIYCFIAVWAIHIASQAKDRFGAGLAIGVGGVVFWHTIANVGMALGVLPVVGITLPLISYGGSSVVATMVSFGLLMNVSMRR